MSIKFLNNGLFTFVGETEVCQVPDPHLFLVKNFVLLIVSDQVVLDQFVVDNSWFDSFSIPFNLALELELFAYVGQH
jgi:hypothetical protein